MVGAEKMGQVPGEQEKVLLRALLIERERGQLNEITYSCISIATGCQFRICAVIPQMYIHGRE